MGYGLNDYNLSGKEIFESLVGFGLSGYSKRHLEKADLSFTKKEWFAHKLIGYIQAIPVVGAFGCLLERAVQIGHIQTIDPGQAAKTSLVVGTILGMKKGFRSPLRVRVIPINEKELPSSSRKPWQIRYCQGILCLDRESLLKYFGPPYIVNAMYAKNGKIFQTFYINSIAKEEILSLCFRNLPFKEKVIIEIISPQSPNIPPLTFYFTPSETPEENEIAGTKYQFIPGKMQASTKKKTVLERKGKDSEKDAMKFSSHAEEIEEEEKEEISSYVTIENKTEEAKIITFYVTTNFDHPEDEPDHFVSISILVDPISKKELDKNFFLENYQNLRQLFGENEEEKEENLLKIKYVAQESFRNEFF